jgi:hypothetical protein
MDEQKKRSLEEKLKEMFENSFRYQEKESTPSQPGLCTVIRRRKGEQEKRICVLKQG